MPVQALACKECGTEYELEARYVCDRCFGPLEVRYDHGSLDADSVKRRIQAGPQNLWRYADFLPFAQPPKYALPAGCTPLVRAPRLAEALGEPRRLHERRAPRRQRVPRRLRERQEVGVAPEVLGTGLDLAPRAGGI